MGLVKVRPSQINYATTVVLGRLNLPKTTVVAYLEILYPLLYLSTNRVDSWQRVVVPSLSIFPRWR